MLTLKSVIKYVKHFYGEGLLFSVPNNTYTIGITPVVDVFFFGFDSVERILIHWPRKL